MTDPITLDVLDTAEVKRAFPFMIRSWIGAFLPFAQRRYGLSRREAHRLLHGEMTRLLYTDRVVLARLTDDPDVFIGWACGDGDGALHYAYVKDALRRNGYGRSLMQRAALAERPETFTFMAPGSSGPRWRIINVLTRYGMTYQPRGVIKQLEDKRDAEKAQSENHEDHPEGATQTV